MNLKNAALLALLGTSLLTILLVLNLINNFLAFVRGLTPAMVLLSWLIYTFAAFSVAVFFYVFHRAQS
jgi:sterol desaturase/sphingolipid hydroxylase (fatty acid hydroxylase superfamily)